METLRNHLDVKKGSLLTSNLTGMEYEISKVTEYAALLKSMDGRSHVVTELENLKLFYKPSDEKKA